MGRLSTLVYAPVLFTVTADFADRLRPAPRGQGGGARDPSTKVPAPTKATPTNDELAAQIAREKQILENEYFLPFDAGVRHARPTLWDPMDVHPARRQEIEAHLKIIMDLYQRRLAISPTADAMLGYRRAHSYCKSSSAKTRATSESKR